jgi:hypothetical protein
VARSLWTALALLLVAASTAWADGKVLHRVLAKPVRTPDQRALLRWDEATRTETLVVETTLEGEGTEFAWVLPLPAAPEIDASTTGLFPTLALVTAPDVEDRTDPTWVLAVSLGLGLWATVRWWGRPLRRRLAVLATPVSVTLGCGLALVLSPPGCGRKDTPLASDGGDPGVRVVARERVGVFDTTTLAADDPRALRAWLDANGFAAPAEMDPVLAEYVREGWVFVASKVRRDADHAGVHRIHPLAFTFQADAAVYPMRLTGVGAERLALELYVFSDRRAAADGLAVERCEEGRYRSWDDHDELARRSAGADVLTKLTGDLDRAAMARDVAIRWEPYAAHFVTLHTRDAALSLALVPGAIAWGLALLVAAFVSRRVAATATRPFVAWDAGAFLVALVLAAPVTVVAYLRVPRVEGGVRVVGWRSALDVDELGDLPPSVRGDAAALRAWLAERTAGRENPFSGGPMREEDSAGNWQVRERAGRVDLLLYPTGPSPRVIDASRLAVVEGSVRASDGTPVTGVTVAFDAPWKDTEPTRSVRDVTVATDADGRFRAEVSVGTEWTVRVRPTGRTHVAVRGFDAGASPTPRLDLVVPLASSAPGTPTGADGLPEPSPSERAR